MERLKVGSLVVIAAALVAQLATTWMPQARAASGQVTCHVQVLPSYSRVNDDKLRDDASPAAAKLTTFFREHPGEVVFQEVFPNVFGDNVLGYPTIICIR